MLLLLLLLLPYSQSRLNAEHVVNTHILNKLIKDVRAGCSKSEQLIINEGKQFIVLYGPTRDLLACSVSVFVCVFGQNGICFEQELIRNAK